MTREEIVKIAKGLRTDFKCESDIMVDFSNSIIKELEQEPTTKNELAVDAVSRQTINGYREVLDKIRTEIEKQEKWLLQAGYNAYNVDIAFNSIKLALAESENKG